MTEQRLKEIFIETVFPTIGVTDETLLWFETKSLKQDYIEAMKQAVNEAIQECADVLTGMGSVERGLDMAFKHHKEINRKRILNLKVK